MKHIIAIIILSIVLGLNSLNSNAQNTAVTGQIVETDNYSPVTSATISLKSLESSFHKNVRTNENGLFELNGIPAGSYKMTVVNRGYQKITYSVSVKNGMTDMGIIEICEESLYSQNTEKKASK